MPTSSTLARYVWVVQYLANTGSYVLVDQHTHELSEPALASPEVYAANWLQLWRALTALPDWETALRGRVWLDVFNEPDEHKLGYDGPLAGSRHTASLSDYLLAVMDAINTESPTPDSTLFFLQVRGAQARQVAGREAHKPCQHSRMHMPACTAHTHTCAGRRPVQPGNVLGRCE